MWTPEETEICREIAKRWRKEIVRGDWYHGTRDGQATMHDGLLAFKDVFGKRWEHDITPLLSIEDCLAELERRGFDPITLFIDHEEGQSTGVPYGVEVYRGSKTIVMTEADTPRLACLKALLSVLEGDDG